ncbi:StbB family protein [Caballeronia sp. LjRoot29]|uniref:StbB family protein n=1 Tax=Caballeronia sp. LjRoot29 TaxID=3342315 RepID=UPI003ECEDDA0
MKIAVINFSGNVGKSTVVRHMLAPRMPHAQVRAIESINSDETKDGTQKTLRGEEFGKLYAWLLSVDHAVVDVGASNVEDFIGLMSDYAGSQDIFDLYVVPTVPDAKQQKDTRSTIEELAAFDVEPSKIRLLFNRAKKNSVLSDEFAPLFEYHKRARTFVLNQQAVLMQSPAYSAAGAAGKTVSELAASRDELKSKLSTITDPDERFEWTQLLADSALAAGVSAQIDRAYLALLD